MGLFDKIFSSAPAVKYAPKNENEAWIAVLYACMSVDGDVSNVEIDRMCQLVCFKTRFKGVKLVDYYIPAMKAQKVSGSQELIDSSVSMISNEDKPTLFALVMELLLADGYLGDKEKEIAEYLTTSLSLNIETASKIIEVMLIKNKGNVIL